MRTSAETSIHWIEEYRERRADRRYEVMLETRWKLIRRRRVLSAGKGKTIDLSSSGILFETQQVLPLGGEVELSIAWPALRDGNVALEFLVSGRVVRSNDHQAGIRLTWHALQRAVAARQPSLLELGASGLRITSSPKTTDKQERERVTSGR